jgi:hypothetical protein
MIFFASLRASFMSSEICFSRGGSVFLRSFTVTCTGHPANILSDYHSVNSGSCQAGLMVLLQNDSLETMPTNPATTHYDVTNFSSTM